jgi:3-carboxy-cis,cis-muconate cycloisomerase
MTFDLLSAVGADNAMSAVFAETRVIGDWLEVEAAFAWALHHAGLVDEGTAGRIAQACASVEIDRPKLWAESALVGYPILPLVRMICAALDDADAGWVHYGATTQDIMDTALALQLRDAADRLIELLVQLGDGLAGLAIAHRDVVMPGRTHAQQAVPTTFGAKCAIVLAEITRHLPQLQAAREKVATVSLFGAGGTSAALGAHADPVRRELAARLGLAETAIPWHVARDRITEFAGIAARITGTCVRLARETIDLARTEVGEVAEADGLYRGASSTMPQKANPISAEVTVGFGVVAQAAAHSLLRAMEAGHERSAGEWQIEWQAIPQLCCSAAGALRAAGAVVEGLRVFPNRMRANLDLDGGRIMAEAYMIALAAALGRDRAHDVMYRAVRESREQNQPLLVTLQHVLPAEVWEGVRDRLPTPETYLGSAGEIVDTAVADWRAASAPIPAATSPAPKEGDTAR